MKRIVYSFIYSELASGLLKTHLPSQLRFSKQLRLSREFGCDAPFPVSRITAANRNALPDYGGVNSTRAFSKCHRGISLSLPHPENRCRVPDDDPFVSPTLLCSRSTCINSSPFPDVHSIR